MTKPKSANEHYLREKERRAKRARPESELMAAARREYEALLAQQATKGKGGRPKKTAKKATKPAANLEDDEGSDVMEDLAGDE